MISYPLVGGVQLGGLTIAEAEKKIGDALRSGGFVKVPQVTIALRQVRGNQGGGAGAGEPAGRFPLETFNTASADMLAAAGGTTATGDDVLILTGQRDGKPFRKVIDIPGLFLNAKSDEDIVVTGGDTLYVNKAPMFYIYGEAQRPGPYRIERGMTGDAGAGPGRRPHGARQPEPPEAASPRRLGQGRGNHAEPERPDTPRGRAVRPRKPLSTAMTGKP